MKRFLWLFVVSILLAACLATAGLAEGSSGIQDGATALTLDVPVTLHMTSGSDKALFSFTPTETGSYVFSSYSDGGGYDGLSTYGCLYDADMELLAENAYGGDDGYSFYKSTKSFYASYSARGGMRNDFYAYKGKAYHLVARAMKSDASKGGDDAAWSYSDGKNSISRSSFDKLTQDLKKGEAVRVPSSAEWESVSV